MTQEEKLILQAIFDRAIASTNIPENEIDFIKAIKEKVLLIPDRFIEDAQDLNGYINSVLLESIMEAQMDFPQYFVEGSEYKVGLINILNAIIYEASQPPEALEKLITIAEDISFIHPIFHDNSASIKILRFLKQKKSRLRNSKQKNLTNKPVLVWSEKSKNLLIRLSQNLKDQNVTTTNSAFKDVFFDTCKIAKIHKLKFKLLAYILLVLYRDGFFKVKGAVNNKGYQKTAIYFFRDHSGKVLNDKFFTKIISKIKKESPDNHHKMINRAELIISTCK